MFRERPVYQLQFALAVVGAIYFCCTPSDVSAQFGRIQMQGGGTSISVSNANGVKTTKVNDQGKKYEIIESEEDGIKVKFTKVYGPNDREKLQEDYPDLFMHLASFPTETEGARVELNISIVKEIQAQNAQALEKEHPEAFAIYKKYNNGHGGIRFGGRIDIGDIELPEGFRGFDGRIEIPRIEIEGIPRIEPRKEKPADGADDVDI